MRRLMLLFSLLLLSPCFAVEVEVLDDFSYPDGAALRTAWQPMGGTPPAEFMPLRQGRALKIGCPFATVPNLERGSFDREVKLNLMTAGAISFDFYCDDPAAISYPSIYFRSGEGWYGHSFSLVKGWQKVVLPKGAFHLENNPAGWDQVDTIRISAWQSKRVDTFCGFGNLEARTEEIAVITGVADGPEGQGLEHYAKQVVNLLNRAGLPCGSLTATDVAGGALKTQKLAIFAYSPAWTPEAVTQVQEFVARGGKIIVFYTLPAPLAELLGVSKMQWQRADPPGRFARVVFDGSLPGLPAAIAQNSWNANLFEPAGPQARVIGQWHNEAGQAQGPAVLINNHGAYMGHVLMESDLADKQAFLLAVIGRLVPGAWEIAAQNALQRAAIVGPFADRDQLQAHLRKAAPEAAVAARVQASLAQATRAETEARQLLAARKYPEAIQVAARYQAALQQAYFIAQPSRATEWRAVWNHSGTGDCGTWDEAMKRLKDAHFNAVAPNMWWGGLAHYDSKLLPLSDTFAQQGDQIAQCVAAGKKYGIEVHPWKVNWNLTNAPAEFVEKMRAEKRLLINAKGEEGKWLCAGNPANQQFEIDTMLEVVRNYDVDGVHFDYIRYPGGDGCYCATCRQQFETRLGRPVANWPQDCQGALKEEWMQFRCDNITRVVREVSQQARRIKPGIKISAAVFSDYPQCKYGVGQDWVLWCKEKYLDFVCPMNYTDSDTRLRNLLANQVAEVGGSVPLYSGIGQFIISDDRVAGQIAITREMGADGFILFNMGRGLAEQTLPKLAQGATSAPAKVPHRK